MKGTYTLMITQARQTTAQSAVSFPCARIYTLGPLEIEWVYDDGTVVPLAEEHFQVRGGTIALQMLKILLSQPQRFALNNWLVEQLWPESTQQEHRLDNVASNLRALLRSPDSEKNLLYSLSQGNRKGGRGYRLAHYPQIWVDTDAFLWNIEQATRMERLGNDGFPFWERAYELAKRGSYLPEEHLSAWAWPLRNLLLGNFRQCVHRSASLLQETGAYQEALLRLRTFWLTHPTNEDTLRPLMKLLAEQDCCQEALEYYEYLRNDLAQESRHPDVRTQEVATQIRFQPIRRTPIASGNAVESNQGGIT